LSSTSQTSHLGLCIKVGDMAARIAMVLGFGSLGANAVPTPFGDRLPQCVVEVPDGAVIFSIDNATLGLNHASGRNEVISVPPECQEESASLQSKRSKAHGSVGSAVGRWLDNQGYTHNAGFGKFTGSYNVPQDPPQPSGQILYYFIGLENLGGGGPVNILQPVLEWGGGDEWSLASWACCPSGMTPHSRTISGIKSSTIVDGTIERLDSQTWQIVSAFKDSTGQTKNTTLTANLPYRYTWADVTLEVYSTSSCQQYSPEKVTFSHLALQDESGAHISPQWSGATRTECGGVTAVIDEKTITIQHNNGIATGSVLV